MTDRLRIALVSEHYQPRVGGIELHVQALARELRAAGQDVQILTTNPGPDEEDGMIVHRFPVPLLPVWKAAFTPAVIAPVTRLFESGAFDLVHTHTSVCSAAVMASTYLAQRAGLPTVTTFHSHLRGYTAPYRFMDRICKWTSWPVTFTAVSAAIASDVRSLTGQTVTVLANGIDADAWRPDHAGRSDKSTVRFVTTMRLAPRKRPRALIEMFAHLRARMPPRSDGPCKLELYIIGDGLERAGAQRLVDKHGLSGEVFLLGEQDHDHIRARYAECDVFVLPSTEESFGIAALEARAAGLPVVAMASSGVAEFITHEVNGLLASDDAEFVRAMERMATDDKFRSAVAENNRGTNVPFGWPDVVGEHLRVYLNAR